jgi:Cu2+-exporting ATPase
VSTAGAGCWHCGEPLPLDPPTARVDGALHPVCCTGCSAAAEWIGELELGDYYRLRTGPAARAPDPVESAKSAAAFERPLLSRHFVRAAG